MAIAATPQNFFVQQGNGQVFVSWNLSSGATSYSVQRSLDGITYAVVATPSVTNYLDTTVVVGVQYYYQVASVNGSGTSPYTAAQTVIPTLTADLSLGQTRLMAQQRADMVNSNFVSLPEWNMYINQSYFELYDLLTTVYEDYFVKEPLVITTTGISNQVTLPTDFYKLMGIDLGLSNSDNAWVTLRKFDFISRNRYVFPNIASTYFGLFNLQYRLVGNTLMFIPTPQAGQFLRIWYTPKLTQLLQDTDILSGISGWSEYVIVRAAKYGLDKEESDSSKLTEEIAFLKQRIEESAMNRDIGAPDTISDTRSSGQRWGSYYGNDAGNFGGY